MLLKKELLIEVQTNDLQDNILSEAMFLLWNHAVREVRYVESISFELDRGKDVDKGFMKVIMSIQVKEALERN